MRKYDMEEIEKCRLLIEEWKKEDLENQVLVFYPSATKLYTMFAEEVQKENDRVILNSIQRKRTVINGELIFKRILNEIRNNPTKY